MREEVKKGKTIQNYANSSRALEELINNQRSYNDKTSIGYKEEEAGPYTTKYNEPMISDMHEDFIGQKFARIALEDNSLIKISIQVPTYFLWLLLFMWKIWS